MENCYDFKLLLHLDFEFILLLYIHFEFRLLLDLDFEFRLLPNLDFEFNLLPYLNVWPNFELGCTLVNNQKVKDITKIKMKKKKPEVEPQWAMEHLQHNP